MIEKLKDAISIPHLLMSIGVILIAFIVLRMIAQRKKASEEHPKYDQKYRGTYTFLKVIVVLVAVFLVMEINGIDVSSLITGLGIASVVIAFALEEFLKDTIMGITIKGQNFFEVGDVIDIGDEPAVVRDINLRTTTVETISTRSKMVICNRNIDKVTVLSDQVNINVPLPFEMPRQEAIDLINEACDIIRNNYAGITGAVFKGTQEIDQYALIYRVAIFCEAWNRDQHRREALSVIHSVCESHGIVFPYTKYEIINHGGN